MTGVDSRNPEGFWGLRFLGETVWEGTRDLGRKEEGDGPLQEEVVTAQYESRNWSN